jgi:adenylate cyclase
MSRFYLASLYARTGRSDEARRLWREILEINPDFSIEHLSRIQPYRDPQAFDRFIKPLREIGIPV